MHTPLLTPAMLEKESHMKFQFKHGDTTGDIPDVDLDQELDITGKIRSTKGRASADDPSVLGVGTTEIRFTRPGQTDADPSLQVDDLDDTELTALMQLVTAMEHDVKAELHKRNVVATGVGMNVAGGPSQGKLVPFVHHGAPPTE